MLGSDGKIHFSCNDCGTKFVATTDQAGKSGKCKNCGSPISVPTPKGTQTKRTETGDSPKKKYGLVKYILASVITVWVIGTYLTSPEPNKSETESKTVDIQIEVADIPPTEQIKRPPPPPKPSIPIPTESEDVPEDLTRASNLKDTEPNKSTKSEKSATERKSTTKSSSRIREQKLSLTQRQMDTISKMKSQGMLNLEPQYNRAEIDPSLWANMKYSLKEDFAAGLAIYCANQKGNNLYWCEIYDIYSGKKLAKYSKSWGFKVY